MDAEAPEADLRAAELEAAGPGAARPDTARLVARSRGFPMSRLRDLFFNRLILTLAVVLGLTQALLWHWLAVVVGGQPSPGPVALLLLAVLLAAGNALLLPPLRRARRRPGPAGVLARGYVDVGIGMLLVGLSVAACWAVGLFFGGLLGAVGASQASVFDAFRAGSMAVVGLVGVTVLGGFTVGQARIERTRVHAPLPGLAPQLEGLRIVQISDLHIGNHLDGERLSRMVERTNALDPDVTVITGDIFDFDPSYVEDGAALLGALRARYGVYAVLGNHDHYVGAELVADALARRAPGLRLLRDETVRLPVEAPLYLAGADDPGRDWSKRGVELPALERLADERPDDGPTVLLVHRPEAFPQAAQLGFPLVLAGHTHGGQLALPGPLWPYNLAAVMSRFTRGRYRRGDSTLYVNRGLGVGGPRLRIHCPREIASLVLQRAKA